MALRGLYGAERGSEGALRASVAEEESRLDAVWTSLGENERHELDQIATQKLGVLARTGRAHGALLAMRRNLLRERGL